MNSTQQKFFSLLIILINLNNASNAESKPNVGPLVPFQTINFNALPQSVSPRRNPSQPNFAVVDRNSNINIYRFDGSNFSNIQSFAMLKGSPISMAYSLRGGLVAVLYSGGSNLKYGILVYKVDVSGKLNFASEVSTGSTPPTSISFGSTFKGTQFVAVSKYTANTISIYSVDEFSVFKIGPNDKD